MNPARKGFDHTGIAVIFFCHDGKGNFLFHKRSSNTRDEQGRWDPGGGAVEFGETLTTALKRELLEEYGVAPLEQEYIGFREVHRDGDNGNDPTHWIVFDYKVRVPRSKVRLGDPEKAERLEWFDSIDQVPEPLHSQLPHCFEKYKDELR